MENSAGQADFGQRLEIFTGAASESMCRVYARLGPPEASSGLQIAGTLTGPRCTYAETLPAGYAFVDRGPGVFVFAEALVPEPCYWTPAMPHLYDADVQLLDRGRVVARAKRIFGLRRLGAVRHNLVFDGRTAVLRGVLAEEVPETELSAWHAAETAMLAHNPSDALCDAASRAGVLVVAELGKNEVRQIERIRRWPAVGMIAVSGGSALDLRGEGQNVLLADRLATAAPLLPAAWADAILLETTAGAAIEGLADCPVPVLAFRHAGSLPGVADGRRHCDLLQRDLAQHGQFAGYIV
jgi:Glycosyl hydrolases family 2